MAQQDFSTPAKNDADGHCLSCGRNNSGHEGRPCADECPMYWEELSLTHPDYPTLKAA